MYIEWSKMTLMPLSSLKDLNNNAYRPNNEEIFTSSGYVEFSKYWPSFSVSV